MHRGFSRFLFLQLLPAVFGAEISRVCHFKPLFSRKLYRAITHQQNMPRLCQNLQCKVDRIPDMADSGDRPGTGVNCDGHG